MKKTKAPIRRGVARVPVVMQMEKTECGAAALAMVLAYYGKWISLEQARQDCGVSRDGANARNLALAAQNYGLTVNAYRIRAEQMRNECDFPCIIAWNDGHYVVLCGFRGARAVINDPARGSCMAPMAEFNRAYSGVCLTFQPNGGFEPGGKRRGIFAYACDCLRGTGASAAFVAVTTVVATLLGIVQPTFARVFVDRLLTPQNPEWFRPFLIALCAFAIAQLAVCWIQSVYALQIDGKLASVNSAAYFWKVLCMPMSFFRQRMAGDIQSRQASNVSISHDLVYAIAPLALNAMMMVFISSSCCATARR